MISYVVAMILAPILGQVVAHLINRLPEIIEDDDAPQGIVKIAKINFKNTDKILNS